MNGYKIEITKNEVVITSGYVDADMVIDLIVKMSNTNTVAEDRAQEFSKKVSSHQKSTHTSIGKKERKCGCCGKSGHRKETCPHTSSGDDPDLADFPYTPTKDDEKKIWHERLNGAETTSLFISRKLNIPISVVNKVLSGMRPTKENGLLDD